MLTPDLIGYGGSAPWSGEGDFFAPELAGTAAWAERFVDYWGGPGYWSRLPSWQQAAFLAPGRKLFQEVRSISEDRTPHTAYARIQAPVLVMHGGRTAPGGRRTAEILVQSIPGARLEVVEGAGHMAPLTHADQVNALIAQHIDRNQKPV